MAQMKDQKNKTPEKELNKMETSKLLDVDFKTLVIRMLKKLSEDLSSIKSQSEIKDAPNEIKNNLQGNNSTVDEATNQISNLKHKEARTNQSEQP